MASVEMFDIYQHVCWQCFYMLFRALRGESDVG